MHLREVRGHIERAGCRVRKIVVVTTLRDDEAFPKEDILDLYHQRWHAETDLRAIKTQLKMDVLRCKTPEMVRKIHCNGPTKRGRASRAVRSQAERV